MQTCLFDKTWGECQWAKPYASSDGWIPPNRREGCNERDDNCDGLIDEGCGSSRSNVCEPFLRLTYGLPSERSAMGHKDAPANAQDVILRYDGTTKSLYLARALDVGDPAGPRIVTLLTFPSLGNANPTYDLSPDRRLVAIATKDRLVVWMIGYDASGQPSLKGFMSTNIQYTQRVWFRGVDRHLILFQSRYVNKKRAFGLSRWKVDTQKATVTMEKRVSVEPTTVESYFLNGRPINPQGSLIAFHSYRELTVFSLPGLEKKGTKKLEFPPDPETRHLAFHPTKPWLVIAPYAYSKILTVDVTPDAQGKLPLKEVDAYKLDKDGKAYGVDFEHLSFDPKTGDLLASSYGRTSRWATPKEGQSAIPEFSKANGVAFAMDPTNRWAFASTQNGSFVVLDTQTYKQVFEQSIFEASWVGYGESIASMKMGPQGKLLLIRTYQRLLLWSVERDAKGVWSAKQLQELQQLKDRQKAYKANPTVFSHDGTYLAQAIAEDILVFKRDAAGKYSLHKTLQESRVENKTLLFHPTKPWLIATNNNKEVRVWSLDGAFASRVVDTHTDTVIAAAWFADKQTNQTYILTAVNTNGGRILGKTWSVGANGAVVSKALNKFGSLYAPGTFSSFEEVQFDMVQRRIYYRTKAQSGSSDTIFHIGFYISEPKADGSRDISTSGSRRSVPDLKGVKWMRADLGKQRFYGFTDTSLHIWHCLQ
jgi:WD40 repeat protein